MFKNRPKMWYNAPASILIGLNPTFMLYKSMPTFNVNDAQRFDIENSPEQYEQ